MLIKCPECGKEISDKSKCCIHCGFPLNEISNNKNKNGLFNLALTSFGNDKIKTIKIIRETTGFGLAEAKDVVDNVPCIFFKGVEELQLRKNPSKLIVCGREMPELKKYDNILYYPCFSQRWKEREKNGK